MARTTSSLAGSLPLPRTRLIGQERERATAQARFSEESVPLLTLTGPGGVGKTRLALSIAAELTDHFADGVTWIDLAPLADASLVPATVVRALNLTTPPGARLPMHSCVSFARGRCCSCSTTVSTSWRRPPG